MCASYGTVKYCISLGVLHGSRQSAVRRERGPATPRCGEVGVGAHVWAPGVRGERSIVWYLRLWSPLRLTLTLARVSFFYTYSVYINIHLIFGIRGGLECAE